MILNVSRTKLLQAIEEYDRSLRDTPEWANWESKDTYKYAIAHNDKRYPVKQIIRMATGATDFSGGEEANNYVTKRGLSVVPLENASAEQVSLGLRDRLEEILAKYASARASEPFGGHELRATFKGVSDAIMTTRAISERPSLRVTWSIGQGQWVTIPWIALLDARETDTMQRGVYGVYLFREDMSGVYLALAQGVTEPKDWYGKSTQAREYLRTQAADLRRYCKDLVQQGFALDNHLNLHTDVGLGTDYEASTIAYKFYAAGSVPDDQMLMSDLEMVLSAYDRYLEDPRSRLWCVYAGRSAATNLELARASGVWGADSKAKFEGIKKGDSVWFVHDLVSDVSPAPDGFPRTKLREFRGIAKLAVLR
jgi:5-methylcytosine-specific restriction enzyme B